MISPQEKLIYELADEIRAGRLIVTGELDLQEIGWSEINVDDFSKGFKPIMPDWYELTCKLELRRIA